MDKFIITMFSDYGKAAVRKIHFSGSYHEARMEANRILYSDDKYVSYNVEMDF